MTTALKVGKRIFPKCVSHPWFFPLRNLEPQVYQFQVCKQ